MDMYMGTEIGVSRWEAFFGSAMDAADEMSDTMSETSLFSKRSMHAPGTPGTRNTRPPPSTGGKRQGAMPMPMRAGSARGGSIRGGEEAMSDVSRDMGGLELEGWDEKFVYKVLKKEGGFPFVLVCPLPPLSFSGSAGGWVGAWHCMAWHGMAWHFALVDSE